MAGILNKRNRFIDLIVTEEGRRQIFDGEFKARFASVSDKDSLYSNDDIDENQKKIDRFNLEVYSLSSDNIVHEVDDSGRLTLPNDSIEYSVVGNKIFEAVSGSNLDANGNELKEKITYMIASTGSFASTAESIKASSIKNFKINKFLKTKQFDNKFDNFKLKNNQHTFSISNSVPFPKGPITEAIDIDDAEPFMFDSKLAHYKNFQFLPPVNLDGTQVGEYYDFRSTTKESYEDIKNNLNISNFDDNPLDQENIVYDYVGDIPVINRAENLEIDTTISKEYAKVLFSNTSQQHNIMLQIYEKNKEVQEIKKLDIVNAGQFYDENDILRPNKEVYYVGKIYFDNNNVPTFINIFTLIFD